MLILVFIACSGSMEPDDESSDRHITLNHLRTVGGRIVFASNAAGNFDIYSMRPNGSGVVQLTDSPMDEVQPTWEPNGNRVAYTGHVGAKNSDLFMIEEDGEIDRLTRTRHLSEQDPAWTPSGRFLTYAGAIQSPGDGGDLMIMQVGSRRGREILPHTDNELWTAPAWRPTDRVVLFVEASGRPYLGVGRCCTGVGYSGTLFGERGLMTAIQLRAGDEPEWSPDGRHFVISSNDWDRSAPSPPRLATDDDIFVIDWPPKDVLRLVDTKGNDSSPEWATRDLLYFQSDLAGSFDIYAATIPAGRWIPLTTGPADDVDPDWIQNGSL